MGRCFLLVGANPTRQLSLQPVAVGTVQGGNELYRSTPMSKGRVRRLSESAGCSVSVRCAGLETGNAEVDPRRIRGRLPADGKRATQALSGSAGYWRCHANRRESTIHDDSPARWQVGDIHHHSLRNLSMNFAASPKQPRVEPRRALMFGPCGTAFDTGTTAAYGAPRLVTTVTVPSLLAARRIAANLVLNRPTSVEPNPSTTPRT